MRHPATTAFPGGCTPVLSDLCQCSVFPFDCRNRSAGDAALLHQINALDESVQIGSRDAAAAGSAAFAGGESLGSGEVYQEGECIEGER